MRIEDREEYIDLVAQAVMDKIEERDRLTGMVEMVVRRVAELQKQHADALAEVDKPKADRQQETHNAGN